jgi:hypothetical protein
MGATLADSSGEGIIRLRKLQRHTQFAQAVQRLVDAIFCNFTRFAKDLGGGVFHGPGRRNRPRPNRHAIWAGARHERVALPTGMVVLIASLTAAKWPRNI